MTVIVCLVGASGSGKTTVAKALSSIEDYNIIQSYTTRPPREENEWGHIHIGTDMASRFMEYDMCHKIIAYFNSYESGHQYFATDDQVIRDKINVYVIDPSGVKNIRRYYKHNPDVSVLSIHLHTDQQTRFSRMCESRGIDASIDRIKQDFDVFKIIDCDYSIDANRGVDDVVEMVTEIVDDYITLDQYNK